MENKELLPQGTEQPASAIVAATNEERNITWECNHAKIMDFIRTHLLRYESIPSATKVAIATGISRKSVRKHIQECSTEPAFKEFTANYKFMTSGIMDKVCVMALRDDVRAARLYFELTGELKSNFVVNNNFVNNENGVITTKNTILNNQDNSINQQVTQLQINGIVLTEKLIQSLNLDELTQIEHILVKTGKEGGLL